MGEADFFMCGYREKLRDKGIKLLRSGFDEE